MFSVCIRFVVETFPCSQEFPAILRACFRFVPALAPISGLFVAGLYPYRWFVPGLFPNCSLIVSQKPKIPPLCTRIVYGVFPCTHVPISIKNHLFWLLFTRLCIDFPLIISASWPVSALFPKSSRFVACLYPVCGHPVALYTLYIRTVFGLWSVCSCNVPKNPIYSRFISGL